MFFSGDRAYSFEIEPSGVFSGGENGGVTFGFLGCPEVPHFAPINCPKGQICFSVAVELIPLRSSLRGFFQAGKTVVKLLGS